MTKGHANILERGSRIKKLLAISATALIASVSVAAPAWAGASGDKRIEANYSIDYVLLEGYPQAGQQVRVDVFRNATAAPDSGVRIGTFTGETVNDPRAGNMLEINHVGGDDCWQGTSTPDILPGDKIQATILDGAEAGNVDYTFMRNFDFVDANSRVSGIATGSEAGGSFDVNGPLALGDAEGGAFAEAIRVGGQDANGNALEKQIGEITTLGPNGEFDVALPGTGGEVFVQYVNPNAAPGAGDESTVAEPRGTEGEAIAGCPPLARTAMTDVSRDVVNIANANQDLTVSGVAQSGITGVSVALGGQNYDADLAGGTWTATVPAADLANLPQGTSNIVATFAGDTAPASQTRSILKDTNAPGNVTATPAGGTYNATQVVSLNSPEAGARVHYTVNGTDPTADSPVANGQIQVTSSQTIKAIVVDAAGNPSGVASFAYTIDRVAPGLSANLPTGSYDTAQMLSFTSNDPTAEIHYTTNGDTPNRASRLYTGPIRVAGTQTVKAIAFDAAGNASGVQSRTITIRKATTTTLNVPTSDLKLGKTRTIAGGVSPNNAGGTVRVTIDRPGTLTTITRSVTLNAFSRYTTSYRPTAVGNYQIKASFVRDADALGSTSVTKSFRVVR